MTQKQAILSNGAFAMLNYNQQDFELMQGGQAPTHWVAVEILEGQGINTIQSLEYNRAGECLTQTHAEQFDIVEVF